RPYFACGSNSTATTTERTNWTELGDSNQSGGACSIETQYRGDAFETTGSGTMSATPNHWGAIGLEIKAASSSTPISSSDTGSGAESQSISVTTLSADSSSGTDSQSLSASSSSSDTGSGTDAQNLAATLSKSDTGSGADSQSIDTGGLLPPVLTVIPVSSTQINLSWTAVSGATSYDIERNGSVVVSKTTGTTYSDTGLTPDTTYTYRIRSRKILI
ncbi:MAG: fibronectin type III domain-containing protein, partial [Gemmatimonadaceae bacterium]